MPPTVKRMQKTHRSSLSLCRTRFYNRTDQHLDQSASNCITKYCQKQSCIRIRKNGRKHCQSHQANCSENMCCHHTVAVSDLVHIFCGQQIHDQLHPKIKGYQKCDLIQRNLICTLKCQKQKRCKIVHDCLGNIAKVTGIQCMIIVFSDVHVPHPSFFHIKREYTIHISYRILSFLYIFLYFSSILLF